jgi:G3E family GTPase
LVKFIALSGFLGAGKTTTMIAAAQQLRAIGRRVVVIANDQGSDLVDTAMAGRSVAAVGEVTAGCFCCRFDDLMDVTRRLVEQEQADTVIAESVGSCTDLTATVVRPLRRLYGDEFQLAALTTVADPVRYSRFEAGWTRGDTDTDVAYLYRKQLQDADVIAINKIDLLGQGDIERIVDAIRRRFPQARVVTYAAARGDLGDLLATWQVDFADNGRDLDIDYGRYGAAEAKLAWLNRGYVVNQRHAPISLPEWARVLLEHVARQCRQAEYVVGHVKVMLTDPAGLTVKASLVDEAGVATFDELSAETADSARAVLNARVECDPARLDLMVDEAVSAADEATGAHSMAEATRSFKPGQPVPTHRLRAAGAMS